MLADALARLARDPDLRRRLAGAARARLVADFALDPGIDLIAARLRHSAGLGPLPEDQLHSAGACACAS